ncbi:uncharacterized protein TrAFT101_009534 [Trichoderma asperellum]|uniref:uncharacterized protein n=1 Tax=Trichoderma asperellum TaxID=101201 RepID=UPI0033346641|nr:hypothetical protein TrAFT101_009534 [Trichoderma asperellum]
MPGRMQKGFALLGTGLGGSMRVQAHHQTGPSDTPTSAAARTTAKIREHVWRPHPNEERTIWV